MRKSFNSKGFTLVEVLVAIIVIGTVGIITATILVSSLRGSNKANSIIDVKEEGNRALFYMTQTIRYAKKFDGVLTDPSNTLDPDNIVKNCTSSSSHYKGVKITSFDETQTIFACCDNASPPTIASLSTGVSCPVGSTLAQGSLLDTDNVSGVSLNNPSTSCYFTCNQEGPSDFPAIGIYFALTEANSNALVEKTSASAILFETSVLMRNLYK